MLPSAPEPTPALWSLLFHEGPDAMVIADRVTGRYLEANAAFLAMVGLDREAVLGKTDAELGVWVDPEASLALDAEVDLHGGLEGRALQVRDRSGCRRSLELSARPVAAFDRACLLISIRDCTALRRKQATAEARLRLEAVSRERGLDDLMKATLGEVARLTDSPVGFCCQAAVGTETWSAPAWSVLGEASDAPLPLQGHPPSSAWAECLREARPVLREAPVRELVVPVRWEGGVAALLGVGGKPSPYDDSDVATLRELAQQAWDLAERRRTEASLRDSEARFRGLFESLKEGFALHEILTDAAGRPVDYRYLEVNPAFEAMTGIPRDQWVGRRVKEILPGIEASWIENFGRVALTGESWEIEDFQRDLGRWYQVAAFSPAPRQFAVLSNDITARKQVEVELAALAQERQVLLAAASVARVVPFSLDEVHGRLQLGDSALEVLGQPARNFRGHAQRLRDLLRPEDRPLLDQALAQARAGGLGVFEASLRRGERQNIWTRWTLAGSEREIHGVIQDQTESHELQGQLLQSQKLESLGTLLSGITHDFNNLLMSILGYAEVLKSLSDLPPTAQRGLEVIHRAAQRGKGLVEQLLRFTRKGRTDRAEQDLNATAAEVQTLLQLSLEKRIHLVLELDPELPPVMVDPGQVHQVLMNLATNARDAIPGEGRITIRSGMEVLNSAETQPFHRPPGAYAFLEVEDSGTGMSREVLARVFEPFFTTKPVGRGTGLGLSVVHGIVEAHRGILRCDSEVGRGTRFRVLLPLLATESLEENGEETLPTVLLLAPAGPEREEAVRLLEELGYPLVLEGDPMELTTRHGLKPFGLVLLEPGLQPLWEQLQKPLRSAALVGLVPDPGQSWPGSASPSALLHWPLQAQEFIQTLTRILGARGFENSP